MIKSIYRFIHPRFQNLFLEYRVNQRPRYGHGRAGHPRLEEFVLNYADRYQEHIQIMHGAKEDVLQMPQKITESLGQKVTWKNEYFPALDMISLYAMIGHYKPKRYLEVGSGYSTLISAQAKRDSDLEMNITCIDPQPRKTISSIADRQILNRLEDVNQGCFEDLEEGDFLFIDNSHRLLPNSDVLVFFLEILPELPRGVIIHIHDIYIPFDYPQFMCDRFYSEQYALAIALLNNPNRYEILLPNYYLSQTTQFKSETDEILNWSDLGIVDRHGGSFWFRIN